MWEAVGILYLYECCQQPPGRGFNEEEEGDDRREEDYIIIDWFPRSVGVDGNLLLHMY